MIASACLVFEMILAAAGYGRLLPYGKSSLPTKLRGDDIKSDGAFKTMQRKIRIVRDDVYAAMPFISHNDCAWDPSWIG